MKNILDKAFETFKALQQKVGADLANPILTEFSSKDFPEIFQPLQSAEALARTIGNITLQEQVSEATDACGKLQKALENFRVAQPPLQPIDPELFHKVGKYLTEAIGTVTAIIAPRTDTTEQPQLGTPNIDTSVQPPQ